MATTRTKRLLKSSDVRDIFRAYMSEGENEGKSYREISSDISVASGRYTTHTTVSRWMHAEFPDVARTMSENRPYSYTPHMECVA
jgi:hypothetical protein